jgi:hypothetical protein
MTEPGELTAEEAAIQLFAYLCASRAIHRLLLFKNYKKPLSDPPSSGWPFLTSSHCSHPLFPTWHRSSNLHRLTAARAPAPPSKLASSLLLTHQIHEIFVDHIPAAASHYLLVRANSRAACMRKNALPAPPATDGLSRTQGAQWPPDSIDPPSRIAGLLTSAVRAYCRCQYVNKVRPSGLC